MVDNHKSFKITTHLHSYLLTHYSEFKFIIIHGELLQLNHYDLRYIQNLKFKI
jgi:hypothetical protein